MSFIRKIKKANATYLAEVESYREDGKVKQRVLRYVGKEVDGKAVKRVSTADIEVSAVKQYLDYKILYDIATRLGMLELLGKHYRPILMLVFTQIITRRPIYKLPEYIEHTALKELLGIDKIVDKQLYEALDALEELDFEPIEDALFEYLNKEKKERKVMVLDVTDTYFNGKEADWKSRKGKDGKIDKLIQIALAVTKDEGFPILHKVYEGNINNVKIFQDMVAQTRLKNFDTIILDRGMISIEVLKDLTVINQKVITGLRLHNTLKQQYISTIEREQIFQPKCAIQLANTKVYVQSFKYENGELIAVYNPEMEVLKREHAMRDELTYNPDKAKYMGYSAIFHTTNLKVEEVVKTYFDRDIVEKAYKELKSNVNLHPIRKYRMHHIKAHIKICYLAYTILSYIQYKTKPINISAIKALAEIQPVYKVDLKDNTNAFQWSKIVTLSNLQKKILQLINCSV